MKPRILIGAALLICASAHAVEPAADAPQAPAAVSGSETAATASQPLPKRLDLRIGDIRKYMTPEEFRALSTPPDEANTVIVQANGPLLPMKSALDIPGGLLAPLWGLVNPHKAWRLFLPDPRINIKDIPPLENKIPPPVFRWGP